MFLRGAERKCLYGSLAAAFQGIPENICSSQAFLGLTPTGHVASEDQAENRRSILHLIFAWTSRPQQEWW
jgi:hypothetical protein